MRLLDCTLRDGGHAVDFDWSDEFFADYYRTMIAMGMGTIELGYWCQTGKSDGRFYCLDRDAVLGLTNDCRSIDCSVMVDYHYCSHKVSDYPKAGETPVTMIRVCSRKQDIDDALAFVKELKAETGLDISINAFNITDYTDAEFSSMVHKVANGYSDYLYIADTHGAWNFRGFGSWSTGCLKKDLGSKKLGVHFHDNRGWAMSNAIAANEYQVNSCDTTVMGIGRGGGNLRLEQLVHSLPLLEFIEKHRGVLERPFNPYYRITGEHGVSEGWANLAISKGIGMLPFDIFCSTLKGDDRSVVNCELMGDL